jgi:hypothetical protein
MSERKKTGGRVKGVPNKLTGDIKAMIVEAFKKAGGVEYLVKQSQVNPIAFMGLVGKVLPLQISGDQKNPVQIKVSWET